MSSNNYSITYKKGDVTNHKSDDPYILMHCCNNKGAYNAGVAKCIREKWPHAYYAYVNAYKTEGLGGVIFWVNKKCDLYIANCIAQDSYGPGDKRYLDYRALRKCFESVRNLCLMSGIRSVIAPKIGAGLAGGKWEKIESMIIEELLYDGKIDVIIYEL